MNILGVGLSAIDLSGAAALILDAVRQNRKGYVAVSGVHGVSEAQTDPEFRRILNSAFLNAPDGMPMSWVGWLRGHKNMDRVYGPDLMLALCAATTDGSVRHYLYGGGPGVAEKRFRQRPYGILVLYKKSGVAGVPELQELQN